MYFEELRLGDRFASRPRLITATDMDNFAISTGAVNPLFLDDKYAREIGFEARIAPGLLTLSLAIGLVYSLGILDHLTALVNVEVRFLAPMNAGDELRCSIEIVEKRETKRKDRGMIALKLSCRDQEDKEVMEVSRFVYLVQRKSQGERKEEERQ
jgi:acyl dehydratase